MSRRGRMVFGHGRMAFGHGRTVFGHGRMAFCHGRLAFGRGRMAFGHGRMASGGNARCRRRGRRRPAENREWLRFLGGGGSAPPARGFELRVAFVGERLLLGRVELRAFSSEPRMARTFEAILDGSFDRFAAARVDTLSNQAIDLGEGMLIQGDGNLGAAHVYEVTSTRPDRNLL